MKTPKEKTKAVTPKTVTPKVATTIEELLEQIRQATKGSNYIFRGENKIYDIISSKLYRYLKTIMGQVKLQKRKDAFDFSIIQQKIEDEIGKNAQEIDFAEIEKSLKENIFVQLAQKGESYPKVEKIQKEFILKDVQEYVDFENEDHILADLQHYGGSTNLIDFSYDLAVALFFACDGESEKDGRLILLRTDAKGIIPARKNQNNRIVFQKSVFVQREIGYIVEVEGEKIKQFTVPQELKEPLLIHVQNYFGIRTETMYGDLIGYIQNQERHSEAYEQFFAGSIYYKTNLKKAIGFYTKAIDLKPNFAEAYFDRGCAYNEEGKHDFAIADYTKAIELNPKHAKAYNNRGNVYSKKGGHDLAIADYTTAIELNPNLEKAYNNRGNTYRDKNDHDLAIADYTKAIALNPDYVNAYNNRSISKEAKQDYKGAKEDGETALRLAKQQGNKTLADCIQKEIDKLPADSDS